MLVLPVLQNVNLQPLAPYKCQSLWLEMQRSQRRACVLCITLSTGKGQVEVEALITELMICQACSEIYCPRGLVKQRLTDAY